MPANAGKYASTVKPAPMGSITALSPSPRSLDILWAGTDDGNIQVTRDGGATWTNVTPPSIKPWTRIFNIEAGHFDPLTAYAAANTLRLDEIESALLAHARRRQDVDGDQHRHRRRRGRQLDSRGSAAEGPALRRHRHAGVGVVRRWRSLAVAAAQHAGDLGARSAGEGRRDVPAAPISIAGTHGRGFWILDNVTPLRQAAAAKAALAKSEPYLFKPGPAVRVRFGMNEPTPWPPELPAGENPPPGALIDYYLAKDASGPVTLEILDAAGKVVRTLLEHRTGASIRIRARTWPRTTRSARRRRRPRTAACRSTGPRRSSSSRPKAGMHRFSWDLKFDPVSPVDLIPAGDEEATGAVPGRTYPNYNVPWVPPGNYTVRLTVDGATKTQPIVVQARSARADRAGGARAAEHAQHRAVLGGRGRAPRVQRGAARWPRRSTRDPGADVDAIKGELEALAPTGLQRNMRAAPPARRRRRRRRRSKR